MTRRHQSRDGLPRVRSDRAAPHVPGEIVIFVPDTTLEDIRVGLSAVLRRLELRGEVAPEAVIYDLSDWTAEERTDLATRLLDEGIAHSWDGPEASVTRSDEDAMDRLTDEIEARSAAERADTRPGWAPVPPRPSPPV